MESHPTQIEGIYRIFDKLDFVECSDCSTKCCYLPWLLEEECDKHLRKIGKSVIKINSVPFIMDASKCKFSKGCKCGIYSKRPLDCRLFPLEIIEENGEYYWCIFTICSKHYEIREKLIALIPVLEKNISKTMFEQYKKQIVVSKKWYAPYRLKQYEKVKLFQSHVNRNNL